MSIFDEVDIGGMEEEEARTKWCPFARAKAYDLDVKEQPFAANRKMDGEPDQWCLCIASRCMAWQWIGWQQHKDKPETRHGMCGLVNR
jgi:hypothetical protein